MNVCGEKRAADRWIKGISIELYISDIFCGIKHDRLDYGFGRWRELRKVFVGVDYHIS